MTSARAQRIVRLVAIFGHVFLTSAMDVRAQERLSEPVIEAVRAGVVQVIAPSMGGIPRRSATGFRWHSPELVVTSYHVVAGLDKVLVQSTSGGIGATSAIPIAVDTASDLALLRMERALPGAPLKHTVSSPSVAAQLWVVGYPLEVAGLRSRRLSVSDIAPRQLSDALDATAKRDLASLGFPDLNQEVLHLEGDLLPGDSGAPILDAAGHVVAIGNGGLKRGQVGLGWAIPASRLDTLIQKGLTNTQIDLAALQTIQTSFFSRVPAERIDETLWATASQLNTLEAYRDYLERFPLGIYASTAKKRLNDLEQRYERAIDYYRRALEYQVQLGIGGDVDTVREAHERIEYNLQRAIAIYPRFEAAHLELGNSKYLMAGLLADETEKLRAYKSAIDDFNNAIDLNPEFADVYLYRGFSYAKISDYRYACEDYVSFHRLKQTLSPRKFEQYRQQLRFSRQFLEYHGCDIPDDLEFVNPEDLRGQGDQSNVERDCRPEWWVGEAEYCAQQDSTEAMARLAEDIQVLGGSVKILSAEETAQTENAVRWADELANRGDSRGFYFLGYMYLNGFGKSSDPELAFVFMKKAADGGYHEAFGSLGLMYFNGVLVERQPALARQIWARGAVLEDSYSKWQLNEFDQRKQTHAQLAKLWHDFLDIVKRGTGAGYRFSVRNTLAKKLEGAARSGGGEYLLATAIDQLGKMKEYAPEIVPILVKQYPVLSKAIQQRIRITLTYLEYGTPEAVKLMVDEVFAVSPIEYADRINLDENARLRHEALSALAAFGAASSPVVDQIEPLLESKDRFIRLLAIAVIGEVGKSELRSLIEPLTQDHSLMVRLEAERYLSKLKIVTEDASKGIDKITTYQGPMKQISSTNEFVWEVWTNRQSVTVITYSYDKKYLWIGTTGGLEKRNAKDGSIELVYTTATGLPQNHVKSLLTDEHGGVWVGTGDGLGYLDSNGHWEIWNLKNSILKGSFGADVGAICKDGSGGVWFGVDKNLYRLDQGGEPKQFEHQFLKKGGQGFIVGLQYDGQGGIWISTWGNGLLHFPFKESGSWIAFDKNYSDKFNSHVSDVYPDSQGGVWVIDSEGVLFHVKADKKHFDVIELPQPRYAGLPSAIESFYIDGDQKIWIAMRDGRIAYLQNDVWKVLGSLERLAKEKIADTPVYLRSMIGFPTAQALISDYNGGVWLGTTGYGLAHLTSNDHLKFLSKESSIQKGKVTSLASDMQNGVWVGTDQGFSYLDKDRKWVAFDKRGNHSIRLVATSLDGQRLWVATSSEIKTFAKETGWKEILYYKSMLKPYGDIKNIASDAEDGLWLLPSHGAIILHVTSKGSFTVHGEGSEIVPGSISVITSDGKGGIWVLSFKDRMNYATRINSIKGIENHVRLNSNYYGEIPRGYSSDGKEGLWLTTDYSEVLHIRKDHENSTYYYKKFNPSNSCLPGDRQFFSLASKGEEVWVGTHEGIVYFNENTGRCKKYEMGSGIPDSIINHLLLDVHGSLWIGTEVGLGQVQF